jgi:hypothetical protein
MPRSIHKGPLLSRSVSDDQQYIALYGNFDIQEFGVMAC